MYRIYFYPIGTYDLKKKVIQWNPLKIITFKENSCLQSTLFGRPILYFFKYFQWLKSPLA